jgi:AcrR family transcriptional regulator
MNHVTMSITNDLRTTQLAETSMRIARAAAEVVLREGPTGLTFPAVAEQAGVSLRTVYRHYANKDELLLGAVHAGAERTKQIFPTNTVRISQMREFLPTLWRELEAQRDYVAIQQASPAGVAMRRERLQLRRGEVVEALAADYPELGEEDRAAVASLITVLIGSSLLFDLVDHLDLVVEEAAFLAAYAIEAVSERARDEGGIR